MLLILHAFLPLFLIHLLDTMLDSCFYHFLNSFMNYPFYFYWLLSFLFPGKLTCFLVYLGFFDTFCVLTWLVPFYPFLFSLPIFLELFHQTYLPGFFLLFLNNFVPSSLVILLYLNAWLLATLLPDVLPRSLLFYFHAFLTSFLLFFLHPYFPCSLLVFLHTFLTNILLHFLLTFLPTS